MRRPFLPELCDYEGQIRDGNCRGHIVMQVQACDYLIEIVMRQSYHPIPRPTNEELGRFDAVVWGFGAHSPDAILNILAAKKEGVAAAVGLNVSAHTGANDASWYTADVLLPTCKCAAQDALPGTDTVGSGSGSAGQPWLSKPRPGCIPWNATAAQKVIWLQPHYRPRPGDFPQEQREQTERYTAEMPRAVAATCGVGHVVNPYPMTHQLVAKLNALDAKDGAKPAGRKSQDCATSGKRAHCLEMHTDPSHWGLAVNLVKAHEILNMIEGMAVGR